MSEDDLTRENWRIAEDLGDPVPESTKVWEAVSDELKRTKMPFPKILSTASLIKKWESGKPTPNPYYIDAALLNCTQAGIAPTETIMLKVGEASRLRLTGSPAGTPDKVRKEALLEGALMLMANLIIREIVPLNKAARKAQTWQEKVAPEENHYKASGLEKLYPQRIRKTGIEADLRSTLPEHTAETEEQWRCIAESLPEYPDYLSGHRR